MVENGVKIRRDWVEIAPYLGLGAVLTAVLTIPCAFAIGTILYPNLHPDLWPEALNYEAIALSAFLAAIIVLLVKRKSTKSWKQ